jgi:hypothetical protein
MRARGMMAISGVAEHAKRQNAHQAYGRTVSALRKGRNH